MERTCPSCGRDPGDGTTCRHCGATVYRYAVDPDEWDDAAGADGRLWGDEDEIEPDAGFDVEVPDAIVPPPDELGFEVPAAPPMPAGPMRSAPVPRPTEPIEVGAGRSSAAKGCGCAIAVLVLVGLIGAGVAILFFVQDGRTVGTAADVTAAPGQCIDLSGSGGLVDATTTVDCDGPHDAETFHSTDLAPGDFPGDAAVADLADTICLAEFEAYVGIDYYESEYWLDWLVPTAGGWASGDREVVCLLVSADGSPLVGSARGSGR